MDHIFSKISAIIVGITLSIYTANGTTPRQSNIHKKINFEQRMSAPDHSWRITSNNNTQPIPTSKQAKTIKKNQSPKIQNGSSPIIYASIINSTSWDTGQKYGIYSFSPDEYSFTLIKSGFGFNANGGASFIGENAYWCTNYQDFGGFLWIECTAFSTSDWSQIVASFGDETIIATDMAYCEADGSVYGCFYNDSSDGYVFGKLDTDKIERSVICEIKDAWIACATDASGKLYAIGYSGKLYTFDKSTGAYSIIGETGLKSENSTSGAIDPSTGIFYVATCNPDGSALYSVDTNDASATLLYNMDGDEELAGMYVASPALDPNLPAAVTGLIANFNENSLSGTVSFSAPTKTIGGTSPNETLTYYIKSGETILSQGETSYGAKINQTITFNETGNYTITVYVANSKGNGPVSEITVTVTSPTAPESAIIPPYSENFATVDGFNSFSTINANNDSSEWLYWNNQGCALCPFNQTLPSDDYFITRPIMLEKNKTYRFKCKMWQRGETFPEAFSIKMGYEPTISGLSNTLIGKTYITNGEKKLIDIKITPERTGIHYIAIHGCSDTNAYGLCLDDIEISSGADINSPERPEIAITPDYGGNISAEIKITAPRIDLSGNNINSLKQVILFRNGEQIKIFSDVLPGNTIIYTDYPNTSGYHTYSALAANSYGNGHEIAATAYIGINYPAPPSNVKIMETSNLGEVTMTWDAPKTDIDGNPINPELVSYMIGHRMSGVNLSIVNRGIKGTSHTFYAIDPENEPQKFVSYLIFSETTCGVTDNIITQTTYIPVGKPLQLPYHETFGGNELSPLFMSSSSSYSKWVLKDEIQDQDGDGKYLFYDGTIRSIGSMTTGKIAISGDNPVFSFWYYCLENAEDVIEILVDSGSGFEKIQDVCIGEGNPYTWTNATVPLNQYIGKNIQLCLRYQPVEYLLAIDNLCIDNQNAIDLYAKSISAPNHANPDVPFEINVSVQNNGSTNPSEFSVDLYRNGTKIKTITMTDGIAPQARVSIKFEDRVPSVYESIEYHAVVNCLNDSDLSNNTTTSTSVDIIQLDFPVATNLSAKSDNNSILLSWNAPTIIRENINKSDDIESYTAFSSGLESSQVDIDNIGLWTTIDNDGATNYVIQTAGKALSFPNANTATAFIVFNANKAGVPESVMNRWKGHNGSEQCFLSTASIRSANDDWLISPLLTGEEQEISFFAKSVISDYGLESFEILYSTSGTSIPEFKLINSVSEVPTEWTEYRYNLPEGAKYFAIRCTSDDRYAFLVDDISFKMSNPHKSLELKGYNVYRNKERINVHPISSTIHTDICPVSDQYHTYNVTALYSTGESAPSNEVTVSTTSGIDDISSDNLTITTKNGCIIICGANGRKIKVYTPDGITTFNDNVTSDIHINVNPGIYIIDTVTDVFKVLVK